MAITRSAQFWNWFRQHENKYRDFDRCSDKEVEDLMHELDVHLKAYHHRLWASVKTEKGDDRSTLILSANGRRFSFGYVDRLVAKVPLMEYWKVVALEEPREADFMLKERFGDLAMDVRKLSFAAEQNEKGQQDIAVYTDPYDYGKAKRYNQAARRVVYNLLGERFFGLGIGYVWCRPLAEERGTKGLRRIKELPGYMGRQAPMKLVVGPGGELMGRG
ncbi:MAG TPA: hypothetical protein VGM41_14810 [Chitinophagaceae bacterium]|jgi:hypothetical protein